MNELKSIIGIRVSKISDLAKLAISSAAPMSPPRTLFRFKGKNKTLIALVLSFPNYYEYRGLPLTFYYECREDDASCRNSSYVSYRVVESGEQVQFSEKNLPGWMMIPIIDIEEVKSMKGLLTDEG